MFPIIEIRQAGRLANRMIQYLGARRLQEVCPGAQISDFQLAEWGVSHPKITATPDGPVYVLEENRPLGFSALEALAKSGEYEKIVIADHMQRLDSLPSRAQSSHIFPPACDRIEPSDDELLINVRAAEIVNGIGHYPLVPVEFYDRLVHETRLRPLFMGQIDDSAYCNKLRKRFPNARFISSRGPLEDFAAIRNARNIVISVSTFSWLAAWLSEAEQIFVPMLGFLNPNHFHANKIIDLLPTDDARYRFFLFPLHFGLPELMALPRHEQLVQASREISPRQVDFLRKHTPIIKVGAEDADFDEVWYSYRYLDAALEVSEGWFAGPLEHYIEVGRRRGYRGMPPNFSTEIPLIDAGLVDHAMHKPATQSSLSSWSLGKSVEDDAARAVTGLKQMPYAFHTDFEQNPWWQVDLGRPTAIHTMIIMNRWEGDETGIRASPLCAQWSNDGEHWAMLFRTPDGLPVGRYGRPLVWTAPVAVTARFVRLTVPRYTCLHLRQVQILGQQDSRSPWWSGAVYAGSD